MMIYDVFRGDILLVNLDEDDNEGIEQRGKRLVLNIQNDTGNHHSKSIIVASITSKDKNLLPTHVTVSPDYSNRFTCTSTVLLEQVRTLDKSRIVRVTGKLSRDSMEEVNLAIAVSTGLYEPHTKTLGGSPIKEKTVVKQRVIEKPVEIIREVTKEVVVEVVREVHTLMYNNPILDCVISHVEHKCGFSLMNYQKDMIKAFLEKEKVYTDSRLGRTTILEGIADYFLGQDTRNVDEGIADESFNIDLLYLDSKIRQDKFKTKPYVNEQINTNYNKNIQTTDMLPPKTKVKRDEDNLDIDIKESIEPKKRGRKKLNSEQKDYSENSEYV